MKLPLRLAALGLTLSLTSPAAAQQPPAAPQPAVAQPPAAAPRPPAALERAPRGGVGMALSSLDAGSLFTGGLPPAQIFFPIVISPKLRVEPELGILKLEDDQDPSQDVSIYTVGIGLLLTRRVSEEVLAYVGPRLSFSMISQPVDDPFGPGSVDATGTDMRAAAVLGGEYFFSSRFSLGAEGQLAFLIVGDRDVSGVGTIQGGSSVTTHALAFFRAYIF